MNQIFIILWFWQGAATQTPEIQSNSASNLSFYLVIFVTAAVSFIFGVLLTSLYFISIRPKNDTKTEKIEMVSNSEQRTSIKQCPKCNSTYTDEDLSYCLRDGITLKVVGSMPIPHDPDKTAEFRN